MKTQISSSQLRAARGLLNWSRPELAERTGVSEPTLHRFENSMGEPEVRTQTKIRSAFEENGIEFLPNDGVARRRDDITVLRGNDVATMYLFHDEVYAFAKQGGAISISGVDERFFDRYTRSHNSQSERIVALKDACSMRVILKEEDTYLSFGGCFSYRWMPRNQFVTLPFYVYNQKVAMVKDNGDWFEIFILNSPAIANAYQKQFDFMWERCLEVPSKYLKRT